MMKLNGPFGELEVINEPNYSFDSTDNTRTYLFERYLSRESPPVSAHGVLQDGQPLAVFGACGGATGVHPHSAVIVDTKLCLAICDTVICFELNPVSIAWVIQVDPAT